jgi:hypothetical protein
MGGRYGFEDLVLRFALLDLYISEINIKRTVSLTYRYLHSTSSALLSSGLMLADFLMRPQCLGKHLGPSSNMRKSLRKLHWIDLLSIRTLFETILV